MPSRHSSSSTRFDDVYTLPGRRGPVRPAPLRNSVCVEPDSDVGGEQPATFFGVTMRRPHQCRRIHRNLVVLRPHPILLPPAAPPYSAPSTLPPCCRRFPWSRPPSAYSSPPRSRCPPHGESCEAGRPFSIPPSAVYERTSGVTVPTGAALPGSFSPCGFDARRPHGYPLMPLRAMPRTKKRCPTRKSTRTGAVAMVVPAMKRVVWE